jgi:predicted dehydrogenase
MSWRVAIVGAGAISRSHARACREITGAELIAVCDAQES